MTHPAVRDLLQTAAHQQAFQELLGWAPEANTGRRGLSGLSTTAKALYLTLLGQAAGRPLLVVVDGSRQAETLTELVQTFFDLLVLNKTGHGPQMIPALDVLPAQGLSPHSEIAEQRAIGLYRLAQGAAPITITPAGSALLRTETPEFHRRLAVWLRTGEEVPLEDLTAHLESIGYQPREPVERMGEYSVRGGILDVFPAEASHPVRVEFFGDTVESMRTFNAETQRSVLKIQEAPLLPLMECPHSRALLHELGSAGGEVFPGWEFLVPLARPRISSVFEQADRILLVVDEPELVESACVRLWKRLDEPGRASACGVDQIYLHWDEMTERMAKLPQVQLRELELLSNSPQNGARPGAEAGSCPVESRAGPAICGRGESGSGHIPSRPTMAFHGNMQVAVAEARTLVEQGNRVAFFASSSGEMERLADIFQEYSVPFQLALDPGETSAPYLAERSYLAGASTNILLARGRVRRGTMLPASHLVLFGAEDLFDASEMMAKPGVRQGAAAAFAADIGDLQPGDYVVHATHGIGQFVGLKEIAQDEQKGDFMLLEYAGGAKLYVPLARLDLIQKHRGSGESAPALDKLGGVSWARTKSRVKAKMRDMAEELLKLYAQRRMTEGFAFSPDSNWQREFEDAFEFTETKDQLAAVKDIKRDMESPQPMDRLLCGDVGFGKTEVAMRAVFKALGDGKQVAVLAPTTVLCFQHFETFKRRFAPFPVRVEMFSRFRTAKELKALAEELAAGKIDIAVGTHRLFSEDIHFRDLGLLVVDEEQRFGVRHKERLKQMRKSLDILTMSATPIPRTLHMSMLGLRDLSVIETPPKDRLAIQTVVARLNPDLVKTAIELEIARGGQVYYLHNRVDSIWSRASVIQSLVPEARIGVGHGQMGEQALEKVMLGFMRHEFDVFVCTTIVENGLDIPLANTMVIEHAERYGLSELYQLRGRVGRSNRRAYAYLMVPEDAELTAIARKRLAALREFSDLGAGFKIAALDLELRGAGNMLGGEQHGHINCVGYDMYMSLLDQAVKELRGEHVAPEIHTTMNLGLDLRIPAGYIEDEHQRLRAYKRIAETQDAATAREVAEELEDRYGTVPDTLLLLLRFAVLKSTVERLGVESVERRPGLVHIKFHSESQVDPARLMEMVHKTPGAQFTPAGVLTLPVDTQAGPAVLLERLEQRMMQLKG
ncbi:MAG: transcription-repair coupling factor [Acidobacteriia bacterium]|nr:transcription-repair coupling factor [Terriglobia bacterium]